MRCFVVIQHGDSGRRTNVSVWPEPVREGVFLGHYPLQKIKMITNIIWNEHIWYVLLIMNDSYFSYRYKNTAENRPDHP